MRDSNDLTNNKIKNDTCKKNLERSKIKLTFFLNSRGKPQKTKIFLNFRCIFRSACIKTI